MRRASIHRERQKAMMRALVSAHCHLIRCSPVCAFADGCKAFSATSTASEENFKTISIDRSGLYNVPEHSHVSQLHKEPETKLAKLLKALIRVSAICSQCRPLPTFCLVRLKRAICSFVGDQSVWQSSCRCDSAVISQALLMNNTDSRRLYDRSR